MNEVLKAMKERRSVRIYTAKMPEKEKILQIIEAGLYAASGMGKQSPVILAVTDRKLRDRLAEANRKIGGWEGDFDPFYGAPAVLVVLADKTVPTAVYDGSLVMGNMMLAAHALGLGSCWIHRAKQTFEEEEFRAVLKELGCEGEYEGIGNMILGYPAGDVPAAKERKEGRVFFAE